MMSFSVSVSSTCIWKGCSPEKWGTSRPSKPGSLNNKHTSGLVYKYEPAMRMRSDMLSEVVNLTSFKLVREPKQVHCTILDAVNVDLSRESRLTPVTDKYSEGIEFVSSKK